MILELEFHFFQFSSKNFGAVDIVGNILIKPVKNYFNNQLMDMYGIQYIGNLKFYGNYC